MMDEKEFVEKLMDVMDTEAELTMDTRLIDVEDWDSMSHVAFLAWALSDKKKKLDKMKVQQAVTVRDLYDMVQ